jgi:glutathione S-transferase
MTIRLYGVCPAWGLPDVSTFVTKVDCYLRMVKLPYTLVSLLGENFTKTLARWSSGDLPTRPKGKFPYVEDGGNVIGDSSFIIDYLRATYGDRLGENTLKPEERVIALSVRRMVEEHLYWVIVYSCWMEDAVWEDYGRLSFGPLASAEFAAIREGVRRDLYAQGLGRHTRSEVYELGNADLSALSVYLGDKPYALGERPTELDATVYALLARVLWCPYESPLKTRACTLPNLEAYCQRMHTRYYLSGNQRADA